MEYVLKPIIAAMMKAVGKPHAYVEVCKDPRFRGTSQALKWEFIQQALSRQRGYVPPVPICVDRDGDANRQVVLDYLEKQAKTIMGEGRAFLAENAWQEVEVWVLMGHDLTPQVGLEEDPRGDSSQGDLLPSVRGESWHARSPRRGPG